MKKPLFIWIVVLLTSVSLVFAGVPSEPHDANAMWIEPSSLDLTTASIGHKFNLTIWLNLTTLGTATAIQGWQFNITYNTQYLNITRYALTNNNITSELFQGITTLGPTFSLEEAKGFIMVAEATSIGVVKPLPCNGSLTWIEFEVANVSLEQLTIYFNFSLSETYIADDNYNYYYSPDFTTYSASAVIPEFPQHLILMLGLVLTLVAVSLTKKTIFANKNKNIN
ncbi:MAG: hypothetical protein QW270_01355 [Candidatus Bathyarchaeia archaeon]